MRRPSRSTGLADVTPASGGASPAESSPASAASRAPPKSTFACQQCPRTFSRRENLSRHLKAHNPSKAHCCSICGKDFTRSDLLKRHVAGHERWDKKESTQQSPHASSTKRRKVGLDGQSVHREDGHQADCSNSHHQLAGQNAFGHVGPVAQKLEAFSPASRDAISPMNMNAQGPSYPSPYAGTEASGHQQSENSSNQNQMSNFPDILNPDDFSSLMPFDFSSYLLPSDTTITDNTNTWFSNDFYSAIRETGHDFDNYRQPMDENVLASWHNDENPAIRQQEDADYNYSTLPNNVYQQYDRNEPTASEVGQASENHGKISRISSPPNEVSEEDKWPFQWNPNSRPILNAKPVDIHPTNPLFHLHNPRYDISESIFLRIRAFLTPPAGREFHQSQKGKFTLPTLPVFNLFIGLFFKCFSPQAPVLHHATVNTNDLPPPLIVAIVIIGAIYSHQKNTRRFTIVLLDVLRWNLQIALECDNSLLREPLIIYTEALICHIGLWCGNKRSFELAETVRGMVVTHIRRLDFRRSGTKEQIQMTDKDDLQSQWHQWISEESQRRLYWVIYSLDLSFPALLNLPATISTGEIINLGCPCDEEFWSSSSARNWKNLLGPALVPPSRSFSAAAGSFILSTSLSSSLNHSSTKVKRPDWDQRLQDQLPILDLNAWSAHLVIMTIHNQIFQYSQELLLARKFMESEEVLENHSVQGAGMGDEFQEDGISILKQQQSALRDKISNALKSWSKSYLSPPSRAATHPTSKHFHSSSVILYHLGTMLLDVCLTDLQNSIGKDGAAGMPQAMLNLTDWMTRQPTEAEESAFTAVKLSILLSHKRGRSDDDTLIDTTAYSIITVFLSHVFLGIFAMVAPKALKQRLLNRVSRDEMLRLTHFYDIVSTSLATEQEDDLPKQASDRAKSKKLLFKSGAEMLTHCGTWGAALNLALLVHNRAEIQ